VETEAVLHDDYTTWEDGTVTTGPESSREVHVPYRVQGGASYRPRNTLRTTFVMDAVWQPWTELRDPALAQAPAHDAWDVRFGLEHVYANTLPGRIGFRYTRAPQQAGADRVTFTFGMGFALEPFQLDVSGEVGKMTSRQDPLWPRDEQGPAVGAGRDRVEDTLVRIYLGTRLAF
jgi:hypothetical protein